MQTGRENFFDRVFRPAVSPRTRNIISNQVKNFVTNTPSTLANNNNNNNDDRKKAHFFSLLKCYISYCYYTEENKATCLKTKNNMTIIFLKSGLINEQIN